MEQETREKCGTLSRTAFLGTARLGITPQNQRVTLKFGTFNPGRKTQNDLLRSMTERMKLGECNSESNHLIVAVEGSKIRPESFTLDPTTQDGRRKLKTVTFSTSGSVTLEVLAGMHRVKAARSASAALRLQLNNLQKRFGSGREDSEGEGNEDRPLFDAVENEMAALKDVVELVEEWPVDFYNIGETQSDPPTVSERVLTRKKTCYELSQSSSPLGFVWAEERMCSFVFWQRTAGIKVPRKPARKRFPTSSVGTFILPVHPKTGDTWSKATEFSTSYVIGSRLGAWQPPRFRYPLTYTAPGSYRLTPSTKSPLVLHPRLALSSIPFRRFPTESRQTAHVHRNRPHPQEVYAALRSDRGSTCRSSTLA